MADGKPPRDFSIPGTCLAALGSWRPGDPPRGQHHRRRFQAIAPRQFANAKDNAVVLCPCQPGVGPEKPVPDRENGCVIDARLCERDGVVDAVHVDRDQNRLQTLLQPLRQANVAVLDGFDDEYYEPVSQPGGGWYIEQD